MAQAYWRYVADNGNFKFYDHLPIETDRTNLVVQVTLPGMAAAITLVNTTLGYDLTNPATFPITIEPGDMVPPLSSFADGIYRFQISYSIGETSYTYDEYQLYIPMIDDCINTKLNSYLESVCSKCGNKDLFHSLTELVILRQGALLDIKNGRITKAAQKVVLMGNICTGTGCNCICGC
jgi:hypothetical protein